MRRRQVTALAIGAWLVLGALLVHRAAAQMACGQVLGSGIYAKWIATGGESGFLGCPIGPEVEAGSSPRGTTGRFAEFRGGDGGFLVWHGSGPLRGRSFEVHGCNYKVYKNLGGTSSWLGYPVSDEHDAPGGKQSDFEGGAIKWDARTRECRAERRAGGGSGGDDGSGGECTGITGTWRWFNGKNVQILSGGKLAVEGESAPGSWELVDAGQRRYRLRWDAGWVDELQLAPDGRRLEGTNQTGTAVSGVRDCRDGGADIDGGGAEPGDGGSGGGGGGGGGGGEAPGDCTSVEGTWLWFNGKSVVIRGGGRVDGPDDQATWQLVDPGPRRYRLQWGAGWVDELQLSADGRRLDGTNQTGAQVSATRECRGGGPGGEGTGGGGGGICADPRTLGIMDEWLARAVPPQKPGESLRYEAWGRLVGRSLTATLTTSGPPDTPLTRCEWLWAHAASLRSANHLGTLQEFVEQRVRGMV